MIELDRIEAIVAEIERLQAAIGFPCNDPGDRESGVILDRIIAAREAKNQTRAKQCTEI